MSGQSLVGWWIVLWGSFGQGQVEATSVDIVLNTPSVTGKKPLWSVRTIRCPQHVGHQWKTKPCRATELK